MAVDPFEHVMDSSEWHFLESLKWTIHLPVIGRFTITKFMILELLAAGLIIAIYVPVARRAQNGETPRGGFWNTFESILTFLRDKVARPCIGEHEADRYVPFIWTTFLFILICNLLGLIPWLGSPTASITVTGALALCAFLVIHGGAVFEMGVGHYLKSYVPHIDVPFGMGYVIIPMIVIIEAVGNLIKAFVLAVRLFANMFAGHTVLAVILGFIVMARYATLFWPITFASVLGVTALSLLELFVAFLQAFIFTFLTALFIGMALHPQH
jgi:F-type H+-transporting ATPase subunit a